MYRAAPDALGEVWRELQKGGFGRRVLAEVRWSWQEIERGDFWTDWLRRA